MSFTALYRFHKELNRPFSSTEALVSRALGLVAKRLPADRLSWFFLDPREMILSPGLCLMNGRRMEMEEEIHLLERSPLWRLVEGRRSCLGYVHPHPILYVPLRTLMPPDGGPSSGGERARGILRLERPGSRRRFGRVEERLALSFAAELAQNLDQAELAHRGRDQLKRMEALTELTAIFASSLRVEDGLKLILQGIQRHFYLDRVRLYLVDRGARKLRGELAVEMRGRVAGLRCEEYPMTPGAHRFVDMLLGGSADLWMDRYRETVLHVPLTVQGAGIGLLVMDNLLSQEAIGPEDAELLKSFAGQIALAVDNARLFDEVQALSLYDGLTGLPVRRYFTARFHEELYRAQRSGQTLALALMDIDYFKGVNDTYGHQIGDQVLQGVGRAIMANLRKIDFPCRYGGDEILLLLPQAGEEEAVRILGRLAEGIKQVRVPVPFSRAQEVRVTLSVGIAIYPKDGTSLDELVHKADQALYWVKSNGRDGVASCARAAGEPAGSPKGPEPAP